MAPKSDILSQLNPQQRRAVEHVQGPVLILAGAGSGKTRTITHKIAYLLEQGLCSPESILAVTFTNKAAEEMKTRVGELLPGTTRLPLISTFHSFGVRLLRKHAPVLGYGQDFAICDVDDQKRVFRGIYRQLGLKNEDISVDKVRSVISQAKNRSWGPETYLEKSRDLDSEVIHRVFSEYEKSLKSMNGVDFDDLILLSVKLLRVEELRARYSSNFRYLLIDEYQDTNSPQYDLIKLLTHSHQNLSAVGDEDQSIYGFRGADINNILRFEKDFPGAEIVKLEQNYRSTQNILDAAGAVVSNNLERIKKVLWTEAPSGEPITVYAADDARAEAGFVARMIYQHLQQGIEGVAVLYRTNFQSRHFEEALRRYSIGYRLIGSVSFYHRKEIRDALAYLRVSRNPKDDVAIGRILNAPPRGIGDVTRGKLVALASERGEAFWDSLQYALEEQIFSGRTHAALKRFRDVIEKAATFLEHPLHIALEGILDSSGYLDWLRQEDTEESGNRSLNLQELVNVAREFESFPDPIQEFLDQAALRAEVDDFDEKAPVTLMTLHNAKGLEFPVVFLAGCEDGLFPHSRAIAENDLEEERRLCYVGMTRARKKLYMSFSRRRRFFGRDSDEINQPSRFLREVPRHLVVDVNGVGLSSSASSGQQPFTFGSESLSLPKKSGAPYEGATYNSVDSIKAALQNKTQKRQGAGFVKGAIVVHHKFGKGRVLQVEASGDDLKISVQFPGMGIKKMLQSYAKLKLA